MNDLTRKAANALVAAVGFFQGALAVEAQAGEAKQVQLDALAEQLRDQSNAHRDTKQALEDADKEVARLREVLTAEQQARLAEIRGKDDLWREVLDLRRDRFDLQAKNAVLKSGRCLTSEEARGLLNFIDAARTMSNTIILRSRAVRKDPHFKRFVEKLNAIDGIKLEP